MSMIPYDKKLHFGAGLGISLLLGVLVSPLFGLQVGLVAGLAKEVYDFQDYGGFDMYDAIATWLGALLGYFIISLLHYI